MSNLKNQQIADFPNNNQQIILTHNKQILNRFKQFMFNDRNNKLRNGVKNIYGRHYPIQYQKQYNFYEQWQSDKKPVEQNNLYEFIQTQKWTAYLYTICLLLAYVALLWYITIFRLLQLTKTEQCQVILCLAIGLIFIDNSVKFAVKYCKSKVSLVCKQVSLILKQEAFLLFYLPANLLISFSHMRLAFFMYLLDLITIKLLFTRASALFTHFRILSYMTPYKTHFKLMNLLVNMFIFQYILTILMYIVSFQNPQDNWLVHFGQRDCTDLERLLYSFYFINTTMLTIGYGDIVPVNNIQIISVLGVQLFGVVIFSYVISEIGYTLSTIRKQQEHLQHNICTLSKMSKYYGLEEQLTNQAKSYLINNQKSHEEIYPHEQKEVLMKLNEDLRESITQQNSLSIVKSSLFFLCHWTKRFHLQIAKRLDKKILNPNQILTQTPGKERIYIIKSGKLQVFTNNCFGFKQHFKKLLKTIEPKSRTQVSDNIYGYTQVFTSKLVKLNAISKSFSFVYFIDKQNFLQCVNDQKNDNEYYFQIKAKIDESEICEAWQAPNILNLRQHFRPSALFVIKKHVANNKHLRNSRKFYIRKERQQIIRGTKVYQNFINDQINIEHNNHTSLEIDQTEYLPQYQHKKAIDTLKTIPTEQKTNRKQDVLLQNFETPKEYHNFFRRHNLTTVLKKLQLQNFINTNRMSSQECSQFTNNRTIIEQSELPFLTSSAMTNNHTANWSRN